MKTIRCAQCQARLKVRPEHAGKRVRCPKCGHAIHLPTGAAEHISELPEIRPVENSEKQKPPIPLATDRQKEFALQLGIDFPPDVNRRDMSAMIDTAVREADEQRMRRTVELWDRESEAYQQMYAEVVETIDADDPRISQASPMQMCNALSARDIAAVLITYPLEDVGYFKDLDGVEMSVSYPDEFMDPANVLAAVRMVYGMMLKMADELEDDVDRD